MKNGTSTKQANSNEMERAISKAAAPQTERDILELRENERFADFDHRVRFAKAREGSDAIVEASDEIISMLLSSVSPIDLKNPDAPAPVLHDSVPYMTYNGVMVTKIGWTEKVEEYMNRDWNALIHGPGQGKNSANGI